MPAYDTARFDPPAPVAVVAVRNQISGAISSAVPMLLDSGADVTLVPRSCIAEVGLTLDATEEYELVGFDGSTSLAPSAELDVIFENKAFRGRYLILDQECGVLGRDVLNLSTLVLDGPRLEWNARVTT